MWLAVDAEVDAGATARATRRENLKPLKLRKEPDSLVLAMLDHPEDELSLFVRQVTVVLGFVHRMREQSPNYLIRNNSVELVNTVMG